jgi:hypothetical protein
MGEGAMQSLTVEGVVSDNGTLRIEKIEVTVDLPPGLVQVEVTLRPRGGESVKRFDWDSLYGIAKGTWADIDPAEYVRELREDRELP